MSERKAVIKKADMPDSMQQEAVDIASQVSRLSIAPMFMFGVGICPGSTLCWPGCSAADQIPAQWHGYSAHAATCSNLKGVTVLQHLSRANQ